MDERLIKYKPATFKPPEIPKKKENIYLYKCIDCCRLEVQTGNGQSKEARCIHCGGRAIAVGTVELLPCKD